MRLAIFAAFPHELRRLLGRLRPERTLRRRPFTLSFIKRPPFEIIAVQTGMGTGNAEAALRYVLNAHGPDFVLSLGFGGALYDGAAAGDLVWASRVGIISGDRETSFLELPAAGELASRLSEKVAMREGCIITLESRTTKAEIRRRLSGALHSPVCDMETFHLATLALRQGIPFFAVRAITDLSDEDVPGELFGVSDASGRYRLSRALCLFLRNPGLVPAAIRLGRCSATASENLWLAANALIESL